MLKNTPFPLSVLFWFGFCCCCCCFCFILLCFVLCRIDGCSLHTKIRSWRPHESRWLIYLYPSLPVEHRPSTTPRHCTLFWAAVVIPDRLVSLDMRSKLSVLVWETLSTSMGNSQYEYGKLTVRVWETLSTSMGKLSVRVWETLSTSMGNSQYDRAPD